MKPGRRPKAPRSVARAVLLPGGEQWTPGQGVPRSGRVKTSTPSPEPAQTGADTLIAIAWEGPRIRVSLRVQGRTAYYMRGVGGVLVLDAWMTLPPLARAPRHAGLEDRARAAAEGWVRAEAAHR